MLGRHFSPSGTRQILVVDDNALMRMLLASMLMQRGFTVIEAASAEEALDVLRAKTVDLLVLDVMLTGMSGIDLCQIVREDCDLADLPVVAFTAGHHVARVAQMKMAGFNEFLFKPVDSDKLDNMLEIVFPSH